MKKILMFIFIAATSSSFTGYSDANAGTYESCSYEASVHNQAYLRQIWAQGNLPPSQVLHYVRETAQARRALADCLMT